MKLNDKYFSKILILSILLSYLASSCDKGFDDLNVNRTAALAVNPVFTLNNATINTSFPSGTILYEIGIIN